MRQGRQDSASAPLVSVIVLNFNGQDFIDKCLDSLLAQTYPSLEIVVVDNASSDGSLVFVSGRYPEVMVVANERNLGFAEGNNVGIRRSTGKYVALLNTDAEADPNWILELVGVAEANPKIGMCASKVLFAQQRNRINSAGLLIYADLTAVNHGMGQEDRGQFDRLEKTFGPYGAAAFYRREMLDETGLFDPDYFMFREEDDLAWRGQLAGWVCYYVPAAVVYHQRSASAGIGSRLKLYYGERNRIWNAMKVLTLREFLVTVPATLRRYAFVGKALRRSGTSAPGIRHDRISGYGILTTLCRAWVDGLRRAPVVREKERSANRVLGLPTGAKAREILREYGGTLEDLAGLYT